MKLGHKKMKLFGFQFYVPINDEEQEEQVHKPPPPEYSSAPTGSRPISPPPLLHHDVQEKRDLESHVAASEGVSAAADVITGNPPSSAAQVEEVHTPPPSEYSPAPTGDGPPVTLLLHAVQEKRVLESQDAADVITGSPTSPASSDDDGTKIPMKRKFAEEIHDHPSSSLTNINNNNNNNNENEPRSVIIFRKSTDDQNIVDDKAAAGSSSL
ncbi:hypothetical protein ACP275_07G085500 [Erythranthe tilingii]